MKVHEIMTAHARCVGPENTLVEAAGLMRELDVGALPVCDDDRLAGMVTDRDIVLRGTADGCDPNSTPVRDVMSSGVEYIFADQDVEEAVELMERRRIRRLPVMSREKRLVGILSLGDVATSSNPAFSGMALRDVSQPSEPSARQRRLAQQSEPSRPSAAPGARKRPGGGQRGGGRGQGATLEKRGGRSGARGRSPTRSLQRGGERKRAGAKSPARSRGRRSRTRSAR